VKDIIRKKHEIALFYTSKGTIEEHFVNLKDKRKLEEMR
jgi:hypothetical protein